MSRQKKIKHANSTYFFYSFPLSLISMLILFVLYVLCLCVGSWVKIPSCVALLYFYYHLCLVTK